MMRPFADLLPVAILVTLVVLIFAAFFKLERDRMAHELEMAKHGFYKKGNWQRVTTGTVQND